VLLVKANAKDTLFRGSLSLSQPPATTASSLTWFRHLGALLLEGENRKVTAVRKKYGDLLLDKVTEVHKKYRDVKHNPKDEHAGSSESAGHVPEENTEPNLSALQLGEPDPAPWPFRILFVGVNDDEMPDLGLKAEYDEINTALKSTFGIDMPPTDKPSLKQIPYAAWSEVLLEIIDYKPTILHLGCHSQTDNGLRLYRNTVKPEDMIKAISTWNTESRKKGQHEIRVIVVNACDSDVHAKELSQCVDFTIGHHAPLDDDKAIQFSKMLYTCLFRGMNLQASFKMAESSSSSKGYNVFPKKDPEKFSFLKQAGHQKQGVTGADSTDSQKVKF
jgi:hypothetical protein